MKKNKHTSLPIHVLILVHCGWDKIGFNPGIVFNPVLTAPVLCESG